MERLSPRGSTDVEDGLSLGYEQARERTVPAASTSWCSAPTASQRRHDRPREHRRPHRGGGRDGIHLVTVGYGMGNYNDHLMEQLADKGDGFYR